MIKTDGTPTIAYVDLDAVFAAAEAYEASQQALDADLDEEAAA